MKIKQYYLEKTASGYYTYHEVRVIDDPDAASFGEEKIFNLKTYAHLDTMISRLNEKGVETPPEDELEDMLMEEWCIRAGKAKRDARLRAEANKLKSGK